MPCDDSGIRRMILASSSPRRRQLLSLLGIPFLVKAQGVDESRLYNEPPTELVLRVSQAKALAIREVRPDELVVAADTIVVLDGDILGKPVDPDDARHMLERLRARAHMVYSGVTVWHPASRRMVSRLGESMVWMRAYTDEEMDAYVESRDPMDKAGAYAIQHAVFDPVSRLEGCWLNVVGLPLCHLGEVLARFGLVSPANTPRTCRAFSQYDCTISSEIIRQATKPSVTAGL